VSSKRVLAGYPNVGKSAVFNRLTGMDIISSNSLFFPCIATFSVLLKELGIKDLYKLTGIMLLCVVITGSLLQVVLSLFTR